MNKKQSKFQSGTKIILIVIAVYIVLGVAVAMVHGVTGSFASVKSASDVRTTATSTVIGRIFVAEPEETADVSSSNDNIVSPDGGGTESVSDTESSEAGSASVVGGLDAERHYYRFVTITRIQRLHLRKGPSLTAEILDRLPKGTTGYIIVPGTDWSYLVTDDGRMGYCFNGYLELTEIDVSAYPDEYKDIEPPEPLS